MDLDTTIRRCIATLLHASYTDGIPTETTDAWRTIAADASRGLTALITRLRAAEARTAWQPIETAPPGEWVLVLNPRPHRSPEVGMGVLCGASWMREGGAGYWWAPTHWMPLPAPPASEVPRG